MTKHRTFDNSVVKKLQNIARLITP